MLSRVKLLRFSYPKTFTKSIFFIFSLLFPAQNLKAQIQIDFSDEDELANEHWVNPENKFIVQQGMLQLQATSEASSATLSLPSEHVVEAEWKFFVRLNFNPSSTNYARVYLTSSEADLKGSLQGYFVMIGNTADEVSLYKQTGVTRTKIIDGRDGVLNTSMVEVIVKVTRSSDGLWTLYSDVGKTGEFFTEGSVIDNQHEKSSYFGFFCNYTATRSSHFFFDDLSITGSPYVDPPKAQPKEIIITEIMADPTPAQGLPEVEYIELYNRSEQHFNLLGYQISDGSSAATLGSYMLEPKQYILLTTPSFAQSFGVANVLSVPSLPSLNNSGDDIILKSSEGTTIDSIRYSDRWYASSSKREGGWSLEIIDLENICGEENNWAESESETGGTPGKINSINANKPDVTGPVLVAAIVVSPTTVQLLFNEKLEDKIPQRQNISITPAIDIDNIRFVDQSLRKIEVQLSQSLQQNMVYSITCHNVKDCAGNYLQADYSKTQVILPEKATKNDVVINEILFNPKPGGVDFIEVFNTSDKYISLQGWKLSNYTNEISTNIRVIQDDYILAPRSYVVFTSNPSLVKSAYTNADESRMITTSLPPLADDTGNIALWNHEDLLLDELTYHKDYHSVFIRNQEGVSLERISSSAATQDANNWKSASSDRGHGTPTQKNSQHLNERNGADQKIVVNPEIFCPEFGYPDFTEIHYAFDQGGYMANIKILDPEGREIKHILNNGWLGANGFIRWDGDQNDGTRAHTGYYMVWVELFDARGIVNTIRKRVAIASPR